jgi:DNA-binding MurR/RpiR family transcriptional regulator
MKILSISRTENSFYSMNRNIFPVGWIVRVTGMEANAPRQAADFSFDELKETINERFDSLSPHLQRLGRYALHNPNEFALSSVAEVARANQVQPSTVVRFAQTFGFRGFMELQQVFRFRLIEGTPELRADVYEQRESLGQLADNAPLRLFDDFAAASIRAIEELRRSMTDEGLRTALKLLGSAETTYVIGQRRAFPVAAYIAYGLARLELKVQLVDFVGGMASQHIAAMTERDLLVAVSFPPYTPEVVKIAKEAGIRQMPILAITDDLKSPLAPFARHIFTIGDSAVRRFRPLSASIVLAQSLILGLSYLKDID